jgi:hypothetical protein
MWEGVGIDECRRFCSELHDCYTSPNVINTFGRRKIIHTWHIVMKKEIQSVLRKPEQEEPVGRPGRVMCKSVFERDGMGRLDCFC